MLQNCQTKQEYKLKSRLTALFLVVLILIPLVMNTVFTTYADTRYYCRECGVELTTETDAAGTPTVWRHPESDTCSHSKAFTNDPGTDSVNWVWNTEGVDPSYEAEAAEDEMAFGEGFIRSMLQVVFSSTSGGEEDFASPVAMLSKTFNYLAQDGGIIDGITSSTWYLFIVGSAFIIMLFRFMSDYALDKIWDTQSQTPEMYYKPLFKLIASMVFVIALPYFLKFGLYVSQAAIMAIRTNPFTAEGTDTSTILKQAEDELIKALGFEKGGVTKLPQNMSAMMQGIVTLLVPWMVANVSSMGIFFVCFSRVLEISVRAALAPLAMTDIYKLGDRSHGVSYLFTFFGVCFQGFAILLVFFIADYVSALVIKEMIGLFTGGLGNIKGVSSLCWFMAAIALAKLTIIFRTGQLAKAAFGGGQ